MRLQLAFERLQLRLSKLMFPLLCSAHGADGLTDADDCPKYRAIGQRIVDQLESKEVVLTAGALDRCTSRNAMVPGRPRE